MGHNPPGWFAMETFWHAKWSGMSWLKIRCDYCQREVVGFVSDVPMKWRYEPMQEYGKRCRCRHCNHLGAKIYVRRYDTDEWWPAGSIVSTGR